jgi:hypothetical protein
VGAEVDALHDLRQRNLDDVDCEDADEREHPDDDDPSKPDEPTQAEKDKWPFGVDGS